MESTDGQGLLDLLLSFDIKAGCGRGIRKVGEACDPGFGRAISRTGGVAKTYEAGLNQRTVLIEFDSLEQALAAHETPGYKAALKALDNGAERDLRVIEGM